MDRHFLYRNRLKRGSSCCKSETDLPVRNGLAYSPADMAKLTAKGMPINSLNTQSVFFDGEPNPPFHVSAERGRHVDVCDLWEDHMNLRDKARAAARAKKQSNTE